MNRPTCVFSLYGYMAWTGTALLCLHIAVTFWSSGTLAGGSCRTLTSVCDVNRGANAVLCSHSGRTITCHVVVHGCRIWFVTLREEYTEGAQEEDAEERTGDLIKLHYEELYDLYSVPTIVWVIVSWRWVGGMWHVWGRNKFVQAFDREAGRTETTVKML